MLNTPKRKMQNKQAHALRATPRKHWMGQCQRGWLATGMDTGMETLDVGGKTNVRPAKGQPGEDTAGAAKDTPAVAQGGGAGGAGDAGGSALTRQRLMSSASIGKKTNF
jgi:hypothetical protein